MNSGVSRLLSLGSRWLFLLYVGRLVNVYVMLLCVMFVVVSIVCMLLVSSVCSVFMLILR